MFRWIQINCGFGLQALPILLICDCEPQRCYETHGTERTPHPPFPLLLEFFVCPVQLPGPRSSRGVAAGPGPGLYHCHCRFLGQIKWYNLVFSSRRTNPPPLFFLK